MNEIKLIEANQIRLNNEMIYGKKTKEEKKQEKKVDKSYMLTASLTAAGILGLSLIGMINKKHKSKALNKVK